MKGIFITFEGFEGSGKSTQARMLCEYLRKRRKPVMHIREPGGVAISENIRKLLLDVRNKEMTKICETLLYMAARSQLVNEVILPALKKGRIVICDRFLDSTVAYQGYGCGVDIDFIKRLGRFVTEGVEPDLTFVFDIGVKKGLSRTGKVKDRIELRSLKFHNRVRQGYLKIARGSPRRIQVINGNDSKNNIQKIIRRQIQKHLGL